jgi:hypothetical protein
MRKAFRFWIVFLIVIASGYHMSAFSQGNTAWKKYHHEASFGFNTFIAAIGENDKPEIPFVLQRSTFNGTYRFFL